MLCHKYVVHILLQFLISGSFCNIIYEEFDEELLKPEEFNKTWLYIPNDEGVLYKAVIAELPQHRMFVDISDMLKYTLYTRKRPEGEPVSLGSNNLKDTSFNYANPTKIITHGWRSNGNKPVCQHIKQAYLEDDDYNVFIMDWEPLSTGVTYIGSVYFVEQIGIELAKFVDNLICQGVNPDDIHMIGHSLGAHIMGESGRILKEERIYRITGLDPAGPLFDTGFSHKLTRDAAKFVDVIHTATGSIGYKDPLGIVDFYPNGGRRQPKCKLLFVTDIGCDHAASWKYFKASIEDKHKYIAIKCSSFLDYQFNYCDNEKTYMGEAVSTNVAGTYFLDAEF